MTPQQDPFSDEFDWLAFLEHVAENANNLDQYAVDPVSRFKMLSQIRQLAGLWPSCACGQLCQKLPRDYLGAPRDRDLFALGRRFYDQVKNLDWPEALTTFHKIEARAAVLLGLPTRQNHE